MILILEINGVTHPGPCVDENVFWRSLHCLADGADLGELWWPEQSPGATYFASDDSDDALSLVEKSNLRIAALEQNCHCKK